MIDFQKVFFRQVSAAFITIAIYAVLTGELKDAMIFTWMYVGVLMFQEYIIDKHESGKGKGNGKKEVYSCGSRKSA